MKIIIIKLCLIVYVTSDSDYFFKRNRLKEAEIASILGGNATLNDKEIEVNNCLMQHKNRELDYAFHNPQYFNMSHYYYAYKDSMKQSKLYKIIKQMPKGAALHLHSTSLLGADYIMKITYLDHLYVCLDKGELKMKFADRMPVNSYYCNSWQLMSEARNSAANVEKFDKELRKHFTTNPDKVYQTITKAWINLTRYFSAVSPLLSYRPVWEQYIYDALKRYREDGIMYVEVRARMDQLYELNGTKHGRMYTAKSFKNTVQRFVKDYPDFIGAKIIFAPVRQVSRKEFDDYIEIARRIKAEIPEIYAGFDLVGQEDLGMPLIEYVPQLLKVRDLDFFFHAGETAWYGTASDENLIDAILLGTKRIGHGYALAKHPVLMKEVIQRNIAVEVGVISNVVLSLVQDVRNHPLSIFLANGVPVVLSSDDPGAWESEPLTDDFYVAFVAASSRHSDLRLLKTLAVNSLEYSALDRVKKERALNTFKLQWNKFIDNFDCTVL